MLIKVKKAFVTYEGLTAIIGRVGKELEVSVEVGSALIMAGYAEALEKNEMIQPETKKAARTRKREK